MKFLVDANLPPALARWLASEGHEAYHVSDLGIASMSDRAVWQHASDTEACIVTKDEDFVLLQALDRNGPLEFFARGSTRLSVGASPLRSLMIMPLHKPRRARG